MLNRPRSAPDRVTEPPRTPGGYRDYPPTAVELLLVRRTGSAARPRGPSLGDPIAKFRAEADPEDTSDLRQLLVGAIRRSGGNLTEIDDYELVVSLAGAADAMTTFVATR